MTVQIVVFNWFQDPLNGDTHPAYQNMHSHLLSQYPHAVGYNSFMSFVDDYLVAWHARRFLTDDNSLVVEFDSQEDLTQFVLAWS